MLLLAAMVLAVGDVWPVLDQGISVGPESRLSVPDAGSSQLIPHNHAFCALLGSTPCLPGTATPVHTVGSHEAFLPPLEARTARSIVAFHHTRSRAPPLF